MKIGTSAKLRLVPLKTILNESPTAVTADGSANVGFAVTAGGFCARVINWSIIVAKFLNELNEYRK